MYQSAAQSVSSPHNDPPSSYVSYGVLAILSTGDVDATPIATISVCIVGINETSQGSRVLQMPEISGPMSLGDGSQSSVREGCRHLSCIVIFFREVAQELVRSRPVQVHAYGVASTSSKMRASDAEPVPPRTNVSKQLHRMLYLTRSATSFQNCTISTSGSFNLQ